MVCRVSMELEHEVGGVHLPDIPHSMGLAGSVGLASILKTVVYQMEGITAPPLVLAMLAVGIAGLVACWLPAHRAAQLDPLVALGAD